MPEEPTSKCEKFMQCFSALNNINKLTTPRSKKGDSELEVLNGVRFLSCVFIIMGNVFLFTLRSPVQNLEVLQSWFGSGTFSVALGADLVADSFFWLSAFLASYQLLNRMRLNDGKMPSRCMLIFTRWFRIWPLYFFALLVFFTFIPLLGTGPLFFGYAQN
jgi:peptidoglycan/LPS O-acetylase OafA/YrhL